MAVLNFLQLMKSTLMEYCWTSMMKQLRHSITMLLIQAQQLANKIDPVTGSYLDYIKACIDNIMYVIPATSAEILKISSILKSSKSAGFDNFSPKAIKAIICIIAQSMCDIFNNSLSTEIFPSKLKIAKVTPIYKSEDRSIVNHYRPISVLPIFSKFLEKTCIIG